MGRKNRSQPHYEGSVEGLLSGYKPAIERPIQEQQKPPPTPDKPRAQTPELEQERAAATVCQYRFGKCTQPTASQYNDLCDEHLAAVRARASMRRRERKQG